MSIPPPPPIDPGEPQPGTSTPAPPPAASIPDAPPAPAAQPAPKATPAASTPAPDYTPPAPPPISTTPGHQPVINVAPPSAPAFNKLAPWALVLSLLGICGITAIIGIILGIVARTQITRSNQKGLWQANAAIIIGAGWGVLLLIGQISSR